MPEARHIAIYLPSLGGGGAERVMVTVANGLSMRGHRVDLVLVAAEGPYLPEVSSQVNVVDLRRRRVLASLWPLIRYLRRARPDAMLSVLNHANLVAILAHRLAGVRTRLVVSERNSLWSLRDLHRGKLFRFLMRYFYPRADAVVAVSHRLADELVTELGLASERVTTIPNPVDFERIAALASERPRHPWFASGSPPVILAVGRLEPQKDYPTLLSAFAQLQQHRDARLAILGEGSVRPDLERLIAQADLTGSVLLAGFQPNPFGWMAAAQLYVLSSRHEGFPNSLVQAMACGMPIVSTDCQTGPVEILEGGKWGRLVPVGDSAALAQAIAQALDSPVSRDPSVRAQQFRPDRIVALYEELLT